MPSDSDKAKDKSPDAEGVNQEMRAMMGSTAKGVVGGASNELR